MLQTKIGRLLDLNERLIVERGNFERAQKEIRQGKASVVEISQKTLVVLREYVTDLHQIVVAADLKATAISTERYLDVLKGIPPEPNAICLLDERTCGNHFHHLMDNTSRIRDECDTKLFCQIDAKNSAMLTDASAAPLWGRPVFDAFPSADEDIAEAGRCLALRRNTACVFHLMRAMEDALRTLATAIGADIFDAKRDQFMPWGQIVSNVKQRIPHLPSDKQDEWLEVHNLLWGVGKAWRNKTMHPEKTYTDEQTEIVFEAVRGFMRHLAPLIA